MGKQPYQHVSVCLLLRIVAALAPVQGHARLTHVHLKVLLGRGEEGEGVEGKGGGSVV